MTRLLLCLIIIHFSCKPTESSLIGKYTYQQDFEVNGWIELYPKSRFVFNAQQGLVSFGTKGNWKIENNQLILNSDKTLIDKSIFELKDEIKGNKLKIRVFVNSADHENRRLTALPFAQVKITSGQQILELAPNELGEIEMNNRHIDSLVVLTIGCVPLNEKLGFKPTNNIDIILAEELGNISFDHESFAIKGNRLIETSKHSGQKIKYKKN